MNISLLVLGMISLILIGCAPKVMVLPRIDLKVYDNVGIVEFSSNAEGNLDQFATQKFLEAIQSSQPGVRILELGNKDGVLEAVQRNQLDFEAIVEIGKKYDVAALITGHLDVTDVKPKVQLSTLLRSMSVEADVEASLTARLFETKDGATLWTDSARSKQTIAHVRMVSNGPAYFDASDPEKAYGKLVHALVKEVSKDLRVRYERR